MKPTVHFNVYQPEFLTICPFGVVANQASVTDWVFIKYEVGGVQLARGWLDLFATTKGGCNFFSSHQPNVSASIKWPLPFMIFVYKRNDSARCVHNSNIIHLPQVQSIAGRHDIQYGRQSGSAKMLILPDLFIFGFSVQISLRENQHLESSKFCFQCQHGKSLCQALKDKICDLNK